MKEPSEKVKKYYLGKKRGLTKKAAAIEAGLHPAHTTRIEGTEGYKRLSYKDEVLLLTTLETLAREQLKVALQDNDLGAKNAALKAIIEKLEPEKVVSDGDDRVLVILK